MRWIAAPILFVAPAPNLDGDEIWEKVDEDGEGKGRKTRTQRD